MVSVDHAPTPKGHTSYMLVDGEEPNTVVPFPESNFNLTTSEHQEGIREQLAKEGFALVMDEEASKGSERVEKAEMDYIDGLITKERLDEIRSGTDGR